MFSRVLIACGLILLAFSFAFGSDSVPPEELLKKVELKGCENGQK